MSKKIKVGYYMEDKAHRWLKVLARRDRRSLGGELAWLIEREWKPYVAHLAALASTGRAAGTEDEDGAPPRGTRADARGRDDHEPS